MGGWSDSISGHSADREGQRVTQLETGEVPKAAQAFPISKTSWPRFSGNGRPSPQCCAPLPVRHTTCSPYSILSSTAREGSPELMRVSSVLSRKQAFVSLRER